MSYSIDENNPDSTDKSDEFVSKNRRIPANEFLSLLMDRDPEIPSYEIDRKCFVMNKKVYSIEDY